MQKHKVMKELKVLALIIVMAVTAGLIGCGSNAASSAPADVPEPAAQSDAPAPAPCTK